MASPLLEKLTTSRVIGPLAIVLALLVLVVTEMGHWELRALSREREASVKVQLTVGRLRRSLLFMDSATRGYLLTGEPSYLDPFHAQTPILLGTLTTAETLARELPQSTPMLRDLIELSRQKQVHLNHVIRSFQAGDRAGAMALLQKDASPQLMARISALSDQMIEGEYAKFAVSTHSHPSPALVSRLLIWLLVAASLAGAMILMLLSKARERDRRTYMSLLRAERDHLDDEVTRRTTETVALALHMERVREDERGRLARELHDELGGMLTAAKLDVARIRKRLSADVAGQDLLQHLVQTLDAGIAVKRRIIEDLHPSSLTNLGLKATLQIQCTEFAQRSEINVTADIANITLPNDHALAVYRIVQEALNNVAKYADATHVRVSMVAIQNRLEVRVVDDGKGFNPERAESVGGRGLQGMRFRVRACGGELHVRSSLGHGACVTATFPLPLGEPDFVESTSPGLPTHW